MIAGYGGRVHAIFQPNGGQGAAINSGCAAAQGEAIFLLDADDMLRADAVETVLARWRPGAVLVQWRPGLVDGEGRDIPGSVPAEWVPLDEGDVTATLLKEGAYSVTVTSGLALERAALQRILPMPVGPFIYAADGYLVRAMAFEGPVQAVDLPLTGYRVHPSNRIGSSPERMAETYRKRIGWARNELDAVETLARTHGRTVGPAMRDRNPDFLRLRLYSLVTDPARHPVGGDTRLGMFRRLLASERHRPMPLGRRLEGIIVDAAASVLPRGPACRLLAWRHAPASRPRWLARLAGWGRRS